MKNPSVSVVLETVTAREDTSSGALADDLEPTFAAVAAQSYPAEAIETIVVLDPDVPAGTAETIARRHPAVKIVTARAQNYFVAKNAGAAAATGEIVALLDGDCVPAPDWIETLVARMTPDVGVVAGCTRYTGSSLAARTFSVPDFAYVLSEEGSASGILINNVAFRREVLLAHPFEERIRRNGGCFLQFHQLRRAGVKVIYESRAVVAHGLDIAGAGFIKKHFGRGFDGVAVYRADDSEVLRGTRLFRRAGALVLPPIYARRIVIDWVRIFRHRAAIGVPLVALPYFAAVAVMLRLIEFLGALTATVVPASRGREREVAP
ncbi:MAG TPA: glycosyltransferase [Thermoanaerobaculia bacterium]|jgi:glycosyltransferase involved in cell wall biosynthesis